MFEVRRPMYWTGKGTPKIRSFHDLDILQDDMIIIRSRWKSVFMKSTPAIDLKIPETVSSHYASRVLTQLDVKLEISFRTQTLGHFLPVGLLNNGLREIFPLGWPSFLGVVVFFRVDTVVGVVTVVLGVGVGSGVGVVVHAVLTVVAVALVDLVVVELLVLGAFFVIIGVGHDRYAGWIWNVYLYSNR